MALDKDDLLSLVAANKPDNTTGFITPAKSREVDEQSITSAANLAETTLQTFLGPITYPGQGSVGYAPVGSFMSEDLQVGIQDTPSTITFGTGGLTTGGGITVGADGVITVNTSGYYAVKQRFRAGRTGGSGTSDVFFWAEISTDGGSVWNVIGNSVDVPLGNSNDTVLFFDLSNLYLTAGIKLRNRFARSSTGNNSGDLRTATPSAALTGLGVPISPSAQATIYMLDQ